MGCSNTKPTPVPRNPIEELQLRELQRERCEREWQKEKEQIRKLHKKLAKKQKKKKGKTSKTNAENLKNDNEDGIDQAISNCATEINKQEDLNLVIENTIQTQLKNDLCAFVLDQSAFTMEFFGNYENELTATLAEFLDKENECNKNLDEHSIFMANPLDAAVAKWVRFKPIHGPEKFHSQVLQLPVIYVIFENIDISRPNDANYDSITPLCKVNMETDSYRTTPCKEDYIDILREIKWKGYIRLRLRDDNSKTKNVNEIYAIGKSNQSNKSVYGSKTISMASSGYGSEGDYDYIYITLLNTHQPLAKLKMDKQPKGKKLNTSILPDSCASSLSKYIDVSLFADNDDDEDEEIDDDASDVERRKEKRSKAFRDYETMQAIRRFKLEQERRRKLLQQRYLNSKEFMCYFGELMRQKLLKQLPIEDDDLETATYRCASIFTKNYEFIPAIHVAQNAQSWPECALQFRVRERPVKTHPQTGEQIQWPTEAMIKQIESFGYHVIPLGYAPKKRRNPFRELEWRIVFPKAERYLELHLSHTQVKVLMMMKALVKTFIEPVEKDKALLFAMDHIRTHLFWECERDYTAWPEEFLGDVLVRFIESFLYRLRYKRLRDYFIEERNLFESIPEYSLMTLYTILADIAANPLMHLMVAFRNLEFNEKFFPKLNFKNIFLNLGYDNVVHLKQLSKNSHVLVDGESDGSESELYMDRGAVGLLGRENHGERVTGKLRRRTCQLKLEIDKCKEEVKSRRPSVESIDVEFLFSNEICSTFTGRINQGVESLRRTNLLEMLLEHFVAMVRKSAKFGNIELPQAWLSQARRLNKCYNNFGCDMYAKDYESSISIIGNMLEELKDSGELSEDSIPSLPRRISEKVPKRKINKTTENNAYEEVIPMDDVLPPIQNALKAWENKLQKKQYSRESSAENEEPMNLKTVVAEVYSVEQKCQLKVSRKSRKKESISIAINTNKNEEILVNKRNSKEYSPVDIFREAREEEKKHEKAEANKLKTQPLDIISTELETKVTKKSSPKAENSYINEAYDSSTDEFRTDTEGESSMYSATEFSDSYQETSFTENMPKESQESIKKHKKTSSTSQSESDNEEIQTKKNKKANKMPAKKQHDGNDIIQIETESSESSSEEDEPRYSFKCLQNISIKAILESNEPEEEQPVSGEHKNLLNISYDISRGNSEDRILDLIKLDHESNEEVTEAKRSSKSRRRAKNRRRQRRKRSLRRKRAENTEGIDKKSDDPNADDCVIQIETKETEDAMTEQSSSQKSIFSRYINAEAVMKRFPMVSPEMIETVTESKEKIMATIRNRDKINQGLDILKTKTLKLKGALLQSSET